MNRDEIALYELLGKLKETLREVLEEALSTRDWRVIIDIASYALESFEDD